MSRGLLAFALAVLCGTARASHPDVVVILLDTVRADATSVYGGPAGATPHLQRLAASGVLSEHGLANGLWTFPTVATLLTGRSVSGHGVTRIATGDGPFFHRFSDALGDHQTSLIESFRAAGYRTGLFTSAGWYNGTHGFERGFDTVVSFEALAEGGERADEPFGVTCRRADAQAFDRAVAWAQAAGPTPAFAWVHVLGPHSPLDLPPQELGTFVTPEEYAQRLAAHGAGFGYKGPEHAQRLAADPSFRDFYRRLYLEVLRYTDRLTGDFVERWLAERPNSIVLITADHGEVINDRHLEYLHGEGVTPLGPLVRIPMLFHAPGRLAPRRLATPITQADALPTLLGLANVPLPEIPLDGRDLAAVLRGDAADEAARTVMAEGGYTFLSYAVRRFPFELLRVHPSSRAAIWQINRINRSGRADMLHRLDEPGEQDYVRELPKVAASLDGEAHRRLLGRVGHHVVVRGGGRDRRFAGAVETDVPVAQVAIRGRYPGALFDAARIETVAPGLLGQALVRRARGMTSGTPADGQTIRLPAGASLTLAVPPEAVQSVPRGVAAPVRYGFRRLSAGGVVRVRFASPGNRNVNKCHDRVRAPLVSWFSRLCVADTGRPLVLRFDNEGPGVVEISRPFLVVEEVAEDAVSVDGSGVAFDFPLARGWVDLTLRHEAVVGRMAIRWEGRGVPTYRWSGGGFRRIEGPIELGSAELRVAEPASLDALLAAMRDHDRGEGAVAYLYRFGRASNTDTQARVSKPLAPEVVDHLKKLGYL